MLLGGDEQGAGLVGQLGDLLDWGVVHKLCLSKLRAELSRSEQLGNYDCEPETSASPFAV